MGPDPSANEISAQLTWRHGVRCASLPGTATPALASASFSVVSPRHRRLWDRRRVIAVVATALIGLSAALLVLWLDRQSLPPDPIEYSRESDDVVVRVEAVGGMMIPEYMWRRVPTISLYGDGRLIATRPASGDAEPALVFLGTALLPADEVQHLLQRARRAGLMEGDRNISNSDVVDASTTVITVNADGRAHRTAVYAFATGLTAGNRRSSISWITRGASQPKLRR